MNQKTIHELPRRNRRSWVERLALCWLILTEADELLVFPGPLTNRTVGPGLRIQPRGQMHFLLRSAGSGRESDLEGSLDDPALPSPVCSVGWDCLQPQPTIKKLSVVLGPGSLVGTASLPRAGRLFHSGTQHRVLFVS